MLQDFDWAVFISISVPEGHSNYAIDLVRWRIFAGAAKKYMVHHRRKNREIKALFIIQTRSDGEEQKPNRKTYVMFNGTMKDKRASR